MANDCYAEIIVTGYKDNVDEFTRILNADYNYKTNEFTHKPHFNRIFDVQIADELLIGVMKQITYQIYCAWSVTVCMMDGESSYYDDLKKRYLDNCFSTYLEEQSKRLKLNIEIISEETGMAFSEHIRFNSNGYLLQNDCIDINYYDLNNYKDANDFCNKESKYISEDLFNYYKDEYDGTYWDNSYFDKFEMLSKEKPIKLVPLKKVGKYEN